MHVNAGINIRSRSLEYQNRLKLIKDIEKSTPATGGRACLRCPNKESMIQEASHGTKGERLEDTKLQAPPFSRLAQLSANR